MNVKSWEKIQINYLHPNLSQDKLPSTVPLFSSEKFKAKKSKKNQSFEKYPDFSISNINIAKEKWMKKTCCTIRFYKFFFVKV